MARNSRLSDGVIPLGSRPFRTTDSGRRLARTCLGCKHTTNRKRRMTTHTPATRSSHWIEHETTSAGCRNRTRPVTPNGGRRSADLLSDRDTSQHCPSTPEAAALLSTPP
jgi:hypothetical protein